MPHSQPVNYDFMSVGQAVQVKNIHFRSIAYSLLRVSVFQLSCHCLSEWERMREQKPERGTGKFDIGGGRAAFAVIPAAELPASPTWLGTHMNATFVHVISYALDTKCQQ